MAEALPVVLAEVEVRSVERLTPTFVRIELGADAMADFGTDGPSYDQRIKLVFPGSSGRVPSFEGADESWFTTWLEIPEDERGHMRTYTVRELRGGGADTRLVVDFVLHPADAGPGSAWAGRAAVGDRLVVVGPRRGVDFGGIEFAPGTAREVLLAGDETAVPAVLAILEGLTEDFHGTAFLEVPDAGDVQEVATRSGVALTWLPRDGRPLGDLLAPAVLAHLGSDSRSSAKDVAEDEVDPDLWETPDYSSSGENVHADTVVGHDLDKLYAWIAGESRVVTGLRRALVGEVGLARQQVAFMGYWRRGVAMRS